MASNSTSFAPDFKVTVNFEKALNNYGKPLKEGKLASSYWDGIRKIAEPPTKLATAIATTPSKKGQHGEGTGEDAIRPKAPLSPLDASSPASKMKKVQKKEEEGEEDGEKDIKKVGGGDAKKNKEKEADEPTSSGAQQQGGAQNIADSNTHQPVEQKGVAASITVSSESNRQLEELVNDLDVDEDEDEDDVDEETTQALLQQIQADADEDEDEDLSFEMIKKADDGGTN